MGLTNIILSPHTECKQILRLFSYHGDHQERCLRSCQRLVCFFLGRHRATRRALLLVDRKAVMCVWRVTKLSLLRDATNSSLFVSIEQGQNMVQSPNLRR